MGSLPTEKGREVKKDAGLWDEETMFQAHAFEIFQKELNKNENSQSSRLPMASREHCREITKM